MEYKWTALSNTTIGTLMASLDRNIVVIALPTIAIDLHTSILTLVWIALGYWIVTASVLLTFGRLADMFGRVKLYNIGFVLFTIGSALCSISYSGEQLIIFRLVQSIGAAFLFSNSAAIITDVFPEKERGKALGLNQISIVIGSVIGLTLGGFLTSYLGWRSIFWINIPIGLFASIWAFTKLKELGTINKEKIDWFGNITLFGGLILLLIAITFGSFQILNLFQIILFVLCSFILLLLFYIIEKKIDEPMFDFSLFKLKYFAHGIFAIFLNALARGAFTLVMAFYLQGPSMNLNPLNAGIYLIPISLSLAISAPISGWLYDRYNLRLIIPTGLLISAIGFLILTTIGPKISLYNGMLPLVLIGAGMGIFASPNRASIMSSVPPYRRGVAAGISTMLVMSGSSFSIGMVFLIFVQFMPSYQVQRIFVGSYTSISNSNLFINNFINSLHFIFFMSAMLMIISIIPPLLRKFTK
ncbi:MAG TPA: MFS transporter [Candidatus Nitrosocosmicus sp.]